MTQPNIIAPAAFPQRERVRRAGTGGAHGQVCPPGRRKQQHGAAPRDRSALHPKVYAALIGLAAWFAAWVWSFAGGGETDYLLFIVSGFIAIVVALQLIMSRVAREPDDAANEAAKPPSFRA